LFTYCTQVLHLAEGAAYDRIEAARAARRFPIVLDAIAEGSISLTTTRLLAPHLTAENQCELLDRVRHKSKRDVEVLIAAIHPKPAVATCMRKLPAVPAPIVRLANTIEQTGAPALVAEKKSRQDTPAGTKATACGDGEPPLQTRVMSSDSQPSRAFQSTRAAAIPLSRDQYKLQVTISGETHDKLLRARDLLRHSVPNGDVATVLECALTLLLKDLERRRFAAVDMPRRETGGDGRTRHIPAAVRREVWRRDEGRCAFSNGTRRCTETAFLEFHHVEPFAAGSAAAVGNIELRCRAHNQYEAALFLGRTEFVKEAAPDLWCGGWLTSA
jgi:hypothetical protein